MDERQDQTTESSAGGEWAALEAVHERRRDNDQEKSLRFYRVAADGTGPRRVQQWLERCGQLEQFQRDHGRLPRNTADLIDRSSGLIDWVRRQRRDEGALNTYQRRRLEGIPGWEWAPLDRRWDDRFYDVADFIQINGRFPSHHDSDPEVRSLGIWLRAQRRRFDSGSLDTDREGLIRQILDPGHSRRKFRSDRA